jgi:predicted molibdopterin-dependent oxidoreductase YjgC
MKEIEIKINGDTFKASPGETLIKVARREGFEIPTLCYHEMLEPYGSCRLCTVEVNDGRRSRHVISCAYPVKEGISVETDTVKVKKIRRMIVELLLARCPESRVLRKLGDSLGVKEPRFPLEDNACILCGLCVNLCREKIGHAAIGLTGKAPNRKVSTPFGRPSEPCATCGACKGICPVGVIKFTPTEDKNAVYWYTSNKGYQTPERKAVLVGPEQCSGSSCEACAGVCPVQAIVMKPSGDTDGFYNLAAVDESRCIGCRFCERVCIKKAIKVQKQGVVQPQHSIT